MLCAAWNTRIAVTSVTGSFFIVGLGRIGTYCCCAINAAGALCCEIVPGFTDVGAALRHLLTNCATSVFVVCARLQSPLDSMGTSGTARAFATQGSP